MSRHGYRTDALALALDKDSVRSKDGDGRLRVALANISKACINPYRGDEIPDWQELGLEPDRIYKLFRDPDELKKAAPTFNGVQILREHIPVSAEDHQPWDVVGSTGTDCQFEAPYLQNSLTFWPAADIAGIESGEKKQLSAGYRYKPDMTPGTFEGERYDGVMREIVGNHVALVEEGRAGPDVVVGDNALDVSSPRKGEHDEMKPTRLAYIACGLTSRAVRPLLALDAKIDLMPIFKDINSKNFSAKKVSAAVASACKGKTIAKDANFEHVASMLDKLENTAKAEPKSADESVSEPQHKAMAAAAEGNSNLGIPEKVGEEFLHADKGKSWDSASEFLRGKGMSEDDIEALKGMVPSAEAQDEKDDEDDDEKKAKPAEDADKEEKHEKETKEDDPVGEAKDKKAMDQRLKNAVTKDEMNATVKAAVEAERTRGAALHQALADVRPWAGDLQLGAFDSADGVYRHTLVSVLGIKGAKDMHASALKTVLDMQPKPGERARAADAEPLALDEGGTAEIHKIAPGLASIQLV